MRKKPLMSDAPIVFVLDDEPSVVVALGRILQAHGFAIRVWTAAAEFLDAHDGETPGCLVADVHMPGMSGLEVQRALLARGIDRPIVFITGEADVRTTVLGMKAGAVTFLTKPVQAVELIGAVREAIARDVTRRARRCEQADISARLSRLTPRQRQVLSLLTTGLRNKQIAAELGTSEKTVKVHRRLVLSKMEVDSAAALMGLLYRGNSEVPEASRSVGRRATAPPVPQVAVGEGRAA
jgi:FixJ family two-component response regulator